MLKLFRNNIHSMRIPTDTCELWRNCEGFWLSFKAHWIWSTKWFEIPVHLFHPENSILSQPAMIAPSEIRWIILQVAPWNIHLWNIWVESLLVHIMQPIHTNICAKSGVKKGKEIPVSCIQPIKSKASRIGNLWQCSETVLWEVVRNGFTLLFVTSSTVKRFQRQRQRQRQRQTQ